MGTTPLRKILLFLFTFCLLLSGFASTGLANNTTPDVTTQALNETPAPSVPVIVTVDPMELTLHQGGSQPIYGSVFDKDWNWLSGETITWSSSNETVVTVDTYGVITAHSPGTATITATSVSNPSLMGSSTITVLPQTSQGITVHLKVEGISNTIVKNTEVTLANTIATDNTGKSHDYGIFTPYAALVKVLNERSIPYDGQAYASPYVKTINGESAKAFNSLDGWLYKIIRDGKTVPISVGMSQFPLKDGDQVIIYYGEWLMAGGPIANLSLSTTVANIDQPIQATVTNWIDGKPLANATVYFGTEKVPTNEQGIAEYTPVHNGLLTVYAEQLGAKGQPLAVRSDQQQVYVGAIEHSIQKILDHYQEQGLPSSEWEVIGLNALGEDANRAPYISSIGRFFAQDLRNKDSQNMGDLAKYILAIQSLGYNPAEFDGRNYVNGLLQKQIQIINEAIYALIAIDAAKVNTFDDTVTTTREDLITYILETNRVQNGWSLDTAALQPDPDLTAMALIALAPYKDDAQIKPIVDQAVMALQQLQKEDGGFEEGVTDQLNSQSAAQVIQALTALGIDPQGPAFTKNGENPVSNLLSYQLADGTFGNVKGDVSSSAMATEQALIALAALREFEQAGESDLFQNIIYSGGTVPDLVGQSKAFSITADPLEMEGGLLSASATVTPVNGGHDGKEFVVFQLIKDNQPQSIAVVKKDITASEEVSAYFNVQQGNFKVKVFLLDSLTDANQLGNSLSDIKVLE